MRKARALIPLIDRIMNKVVVDEDTGCWNSTYSKHRSGHAITSIMGKSCYVHREMWKIHNGDIPEGLVVRHKCDNPACCNIDHLELGTVKDNSMDMLLRSKHGNTELNEEMVSSIYLDTRAQKVIAAEFGITQSQVSKIKRKENWSWVTDKLV